MGSSFPKGGNIDTCTLYFKLAIHTNQKAIKSYEKARKCNTEEHQQKYRLETVSNKLLVDLDILHDASILVLIFRCGSKHLASCLVRMKAFYLINGSSRETSKSQYTL